MIENLTMSKFEFTGFGYALFKVNSPHSFNCFSKSSEFAMFQALSGKVVVSKGEEETPFSIDDLLVEANSRQKTVEVDVKTVDQTLFNVQIELIAEDLFLCVIKVYTSTNRNKVFFQVAENSNVGILIADPDGKIRYCNQRTVQILKSPSCEATLKINLLDFPLLVKQGVSQRVKDTIDSGKSQVFESRYTSNWGKASWLRVYLEPEYTNSNITGVWMFLDDICDEVSVKKQLEQNESNFGVSLILFKTWYLSPILMALLLQQIMQQ